MALLGVTIGENAKLACPLLVVSARARFRCIPMSQVAPGPATANWQPVAQASLRVFGRIIEATEIEGRSSVEPALPVLLGLALEPASFEEELPSFLSLFGILGAGL